ncbi:MAG: prepilin-type N-terminal cleavage/methylation domain-containing protein [Patescibacteria group bacterium]
MIKISNFKFRASNSHKGFTLIELILYISILTTILSAIVPFAWSAIQTGVKSAVGQEVNTNARYISERIKYEIRNANSITSITNTSCSVNSIELNTTNNAITVIDISGGKIRIRYGALGTPVNLNSDNTSVSCLTFTDYTSGDAKTKHIQFTINIAASFAAARQEYQDSIVVEGSAEVRSN